MAEGSVTPTSSQTAAEKALLETKPKQEHGQAKLLTGNEACVLGALTAGLRFYAGYPITPSSEVAEILAAELPKVGGVFLQMEDEIGSLGAVIGASLTGAKAMTATSGPGFSLMQENLGYASMAEVPCVIVDVMRGGPSTGQPTMTSQSDIMQTRWGTHGDHPIIVLTPYTVREVYDLTVRAFNLSEKYRVPVILLYDETLGHVNEKVILPDPSEVEVINRTAPKVGPEEYLPYEDTKSGVPAMANFGTGYRYHVTGLVHDESGFPSNSTKVADKLIRRLNRKIEQARDEIVQVDDFMLDDAEIGIIAMGASARSSQEAIRTARREGLKVGMLRPKTLWPFPDKEIKAYAKRIKKWVVVEMSLGQLTHEVEWALAGQATVTSVTRVDGVLVHPLDIINKLRSVAL